MVDLSEVIVLNKEHELFCSIRTVSYLKEDMKCMKYRKNILKSNNYSRKVKVLS